MKAYVDENAKAFLSRF